MTHVALSKWIFVDRTIARSINLERDAEDRELLERFQATPTACDILQRLADAFEGEKTNAWSLTGPYGTGKSAFCNFLLSLSSGSKKVREICHNILVQADESLAKRLKILLSDKESAPPVIGIRAVSHYESLNSTLVRGLGSSLQDVFQKKKNRRFRDLSERVQALSSQEWPTTRDVVNLYKDMATFMEKPIFIAVDEFGKNLEFQAHHPDQGDLFALQALVELKGIFIWVCLHQAFYAYAGALSHIQREEWQKIQGRFEDRPYIEPPIRSFSLIRDVLSIKPPDMAHEMALGDWAQGMAGAMSGVALDGLDDLDIDTIKRLYPFHPLSVYLVGEISRRFAQNDRTLFSFLSSGAPYAFANCLRQLEPNLGKRLPTLGLDMLYDYFSETGALRNANRSENQRWIEIQSIIASHGGFDKKETKLLKTVGILNLLSNLPGITASEEMIHSALSTTFYKNRSDVKQILRELRDSGILLYRQYANEYRLWEGSDFDLDLEVLQARGRGALRPVSETLEEIAPQPNLVAARHTVQAGTLREFQVRWSTEDDLPLLMERPHKSGYADGTLWLVIGGQKTLGNLPEVAREGQPVIIGYAACMEQVRQLMIEAAATRAVCDAPQLERDGVARREAQHRAAQAMESLTSFLKDTFTPGKTSAQWFAWGKKQEISSQRALSSLISDLCDHSYNLCPRINNEMLNVDNLTSQAAAARNRVAEALANNSVQEDLGFTGYGPEMAVYRTVIKNTGLHRRNPDGLWELSAPDEVDQPNFSAVWDLFDRLLQEAYAAGKAVPVRVILDTLRKAPYGLREGPAPLLLAHYLLVRSDEIAVYEDGVFKPFFGDAESTLLMRRPELFNLYLYQMTGIRAQVIRTYCQVINTGLELIEGVRNQTLLSVVVPLTQFLSNLPEYTRTTRSVNPNTLRLRNVISNMNDPQKLLFKEIPEALGFSPVEPNSETGQELLDAKAFRERLWDSLLELRDAYTNFLSKIRGRFVLAMDDLVTQGNPFETVRHDLKEKAYPLLSICMDSELKPVLGSLSNEKCSDEEWLTSVAAVIMKKPITTWRDGDIEPFAVRVGEIREHIRQLYGLKRIAERNRDVDDQSYFIGVATPTGGMVHKNLVASKPLNDTVAQTIEAFKQADKETRTALLTLLIQAMVNKGDFD